MNASPSHCPPQSQLGEFLEGRGAQQILAEIDSHLPDCQSCLAQLAALEQPTTPSGGAGTERRSASEPTYFEDLSPVIQFRLLDTIREVSARSHRPPATRVEHLLADAGPVLDLLSASEDASVLGTLDRFRVTDVLGSGGMGVVLQADDPVLRRSVAVKMIRPEIARKPDARDRFLREARALAQIHNPHVVSVLEVHSDATPPFFIMPLLQGQTLDARLEQGPLELESIFRIATEISEGLAVAHDAGLIHRDIKPGNIFLETATDRAILIDFGLVRPREQDSLFTHSSTIAGTPACMSPEQAQAEAVDERSDLFAVGCVVYQMLTGELPFQRASTPKTLMAVCYEQPPSPHRVDPRVPVSLSRLTMALLEKNPKQRIASAKELLDRLEAARLGRDVSGPRRRWIILATMLITVLPILGMAFWWSSTTATRKPMSLQAKPHTSTTALPNGDASNSLLSRDREAAKWVIERSGQVAIVPLDVGAVTDRLMQTHDLPAQPFYLNYVNLNRAKIPRPEWKFLSGLGQLRQLYVNGTSFRAADLQFLTSSDRLFKAHFALGPNQLRTSDFRNFPSGTHLAVLYLNAYQVDDNWNFLKRMPRLQKLHVCGEGLPNISALGEYQQLRTIRLLATPEPPSDQIRVLQQRNPNLRVILEQDGHWRTVGHNPVVPAVQRLIERGVHLGGRIPPGSEKWSSRDDAAKIDECIDLSEIIFPRGFEVTDEVVELLRSLPLEIFYIEAIDILGADRLAEALVNGSVGSVWLDGSDLTDQAFARLANRAAVLAVLGTRVTADGVRATHASHPFLKIETEYGTFLPWADSPQEGRPDSQITFDKRSEPTDSRINLVSQVEVLNPVAGHWRVEQGIVIAPTEPLFARTEIPISGVREYNLELEVEGENDPEVALGLLTPTGSRFRVAIDKYGEYTNIGRSDDIVAQFQGDVLHPGKRHRLRFEIRHGSFRLSIDSQVIIDWKGDLDNLDLGVWTTPNPHSFVLANASGIRIHGIWLERLDK